MWEYRDLAERAGAWTRTDIGIALIATVIAPEVARRALGPWIPGIGIFAMIYAYYGEFPPPPFPMSASMWKASSTTSCIPRTAFSGS